MKFYSKPIVEHDEVPLADNGRLEEIIKFWKDRENPGKKSAHNSNKKGNLCYVVSVVEYKDPHPEGKLSEILGLVQAQGDRICGHEIYHSAKPNPKTFLGRGISEDIAERANELGADLLVIDAELSPSQMRNLEEITYLPIADREGIILNVFLCHAETRHARNQVEIAQLEYLRPRIRGLGLNMDQQAGGIMRGRGPGETASELMARQLDRRLAQLQKSSRKLITAGVSQRQSRVTCKRIALVGYTNAGKTSLMNALTMAGLSARNRPFETLDTTTRCLIRRSGEDILLSDTVGFIRSIPERLLNSFESTLSEILETSLLVIVVDAADPEKELHLRTTEKLLLKLKANTIPRFYVFNKIDKLKNSALSENFNSLTHGNNWVTLSSMNTKAVKQLRENLIHAVNTEKQISNVFVPYASREVITKIYAQCRIIEIKSDVNGLKFTLEGDKKVLEQIKIASNEAIQLNKGVQK